jgi:hypothetical protein
MTTAGSVCETCQGNLWVTDGEDERAAQRTPGAGLVPCGTCNAGNWESPQPYPGWPGRCREYACDDAVHPCSLFHDPTGCERRAPLDGCGCDFGPDELDEGPEYADVPWCENPYCHDRVHGDGVHTDENGRPFRGDMPSSSDDRGDDDPERDEDDDQDEPAFHGDLVPEPTPQPFPLTPIYDQLVAEHTYPELT